MVMIHFCKHVYRVGVEGQVGALHYPQGIQLVTESPLPKDKLSGICTIQTIYTVGSTYSILQRNGIAPVALFIAIKMSASRIRSSEQKQSDTDSVLFWM